MSETVSLESLSAEELAEVLRQAELGLEDVQEERRFTLSQTGVHIGARELARMNSAWAREEARLRERVEEIKARQAMLAPEP